MKKNSFIIFNLFYHTFYLCRFYRSDESASEQESSDEVDSDTEGLGILNAFCFYKKFSHLNGNCFNRFYG